jgi:hypothetical protein
MGLFSRLFWSTSKIDSLVEEAIALKNKKIITTEEVYRICRALNDHYNSQIAWVHSGHMPMPDGKYELGEIYRIEQVLYMVYRFDKDNENISSIGMHLLEDI